MNEDSEGVGLGATITAARRPRPAASAEEKAQWVRRYHESGLSLRKFSAQHPVSLMSICRWVKEAKDREPTAPAAQFEELTFPSLPADSDWAAELTLPNGTVLRLSKAVPATMLEQLLRVC